MFEMDGFVSIIPRRVAPDGSVSYYPYISLELMLARRARVPRIVFVDDQVLALNRSAFPASAIPFFSSETRNRVVSARPKLLVNFARKSLVAERDRHGTIKSEPLL
jgi:hypothetical protein